MWWTRCRLLLLALVLTTMPGGGLPRRQLQQEGCSDLNGDLVVDVQDLLMLLAAYGSTIDGVSADVSALLALLAQFGSTCAAADVPGVSVDLPEPEAVLGDVRSLSIHGASTVARVASGLKMYEDRTYVFGGLPSFLEGCPGIRTRNNDKHEPPSMEVELAEASLLDYEDQFLCFDLLRESTVYVLYDATVTTPPVWLTSDYDLLSVSVWLPSDQGARCDDWLDRWVWSSPDPTYDSSRQSSEQWQYESQNPYATCSALVPPGFGPARCSDTCNLNRAHGAPCDIDLVWNYVSVGPQCQCLDQCAFAEIPDWGTQRVPTCAYDSYCDRSCGYCTETPPAEGEPTPLPGTRRFDLYRRAQVPVGEVCMGDNGVAGAGGNYILVVGPDSPSTPFIGCDGVAGSGLYPDVCGVCGGSDECVGCDGVANSGLVLDSCDVCGGACDESRDELVISFGGDTQLGRFVDQMLPWPVLHPRDPAFDGPDGLGVETRAAEIREQAGLASLTTQQLLERPWGDILPVLTSADVTVLCLETVATSTDVHWPGKRFCQDDGAGPRGSTSYHKMTPANLRTLQAAGVDYVALATNHILDFDLAGSLETNAALDDIGILHAGVGHTKEEAWQSAVISRHGVDMRFFSFADYGNDFGSDGQDVQAARPSRGGLAYLNTHGIRRLMPFSQWDVDRNGVIDGTDIATLQSAAEAAGDLDASDFAEVFAFMDVGTSLQASGSTPFSVTDYHAASCAPSDNCAWVAELYEIAGDGRVTLPEYGSAMARVADGSRYDPGWELYLERVASELSTSRAHPDELLVVSVHWYASVRLSASIEL